MNDLANDASRQELNWKGWSIIGVSCGQAIPSDQWLSFNLSERTSGRSFKRYYSRRLIKAAISLVALQMSRKEVHVRRKFRIKRWPFWHRAFNHEIRQEINKNYCGGTIARNEWSAIDHSSAANEANNYPSDVARKTAVHCARPPPLFSIRLSSGSRLIVESFHCHYYFVALCAEIYGLV
jgi:hypothetical protein